MYIVIAKEAETARKAMMLLTRPYPVRAQQTVKTLKKTHPIVDSFTSSCSKLDDVKKIYMNCRAIYNE